MRTTFAEVFAIVVNFLQSFCREVSTLFSPAVCQGVIISPLHVESILTREDDIILRVRPAGSEQTGESWETKIYCLRGLKYFENSLHVQLCSGHNFTELLSRDCWSQLSPTWLIYD